MCANHHTVIDDAFESYTAARLKKLKDKHEKRNANGKEPTTEVVNKLLQNINGTFIGPTVITQGQIGGQVAIKIENYVLRPRQITQASGNTLISQLQKHSPKDFIFNMWEAITNFLISPRLFRLYSLMLNRTL
jgi:hypothetical protein